MRGGKHAPLTTLEIETKFVDNAIYGGWSRDTASSFLGFSRSIFDGSNLNRIQEFAL
jgi:hypothetical protein